MQTTIIKASSSKGHKTFVSEQNEVVVLKAFDSSLLSIKFYGK